MNFLYLNSQTNSREGTKSRMIVLVVVGVEVVAGSKC